MGLSNFNIGQSVDHYISLIKNQGSITDSDAKELTAHIYDATDELKKQGLSEEEAFLIACKRLGNEELLTSEYSKVNTSVIINKIWAYLFIGFNLLYAVPVLMFTGIALLYHGIFQGLGTSTTVSFILTLFHLVFIAGICYMVKHKSDISRFIERQVQQNAVRIVSLSFIPLLLNMLPNRLVLPISVYTALRYPVYAFNNSLVEFSFYLAILSIGLGVLSLVFSINKMENITIKTMFEKPSVPFLILFSIVIELMAASTRSIRIDNIIGSAAIFGLVYLLAAFLITFYNKREGIYKYLFLGLFTGLALETFVGIYADLSRGNTHNTVYFVSGILSGVSLGYFLGSKFSTEYLKLDKYS